MMDIFGDTSTELFNDDNPTCNNKLKKKKKNTAKKDFKEIMKNAPKSPFACKTHQTSKLRLKQSTKNPPTCKSCGFKCMGQTGYLVCPENSGCYSLCSACRTCPENHILRNCASLKQYDQNQLYSQNKFKCSNCKEDKEVGQNGVFHCSPCSFSICFECMESYDEMWERKLDLELEVIDEEKEE